MTPEQEIVAVKLGLTPKQKDAITCFWVRQHKGWQRRRSYDVATGRIKPRDPDGCWRGHPYRVIPVSAW